MHAMRKTLFPVVLVTALGIGAADTAAQVKAAPADSATMLAITNRRVQWEKLFNAHDAAAIAAMYTPDARYFNDVAAVTGREAIQKLLQASFAVAKDFTATGDDLQVVGDVAYGSGAFRMLMTSEKGSTPVEGDWVAVLLRQPDGSWQIARHAVVNRRPAPPKAK